jgi:hypothetical protein
MKESLEREIHSFRDDVQTRFTKVDGRLDRMDATLANLGKQVAAETELLRGFEAFGRGDR